MVRGFNPLRKSTCKYSFLLRGGAAAARWAHNPKVDGSSPSPATRKLYISLGSSSIMEQPVTIPNTEVKHFSADATAFMWENKSPPRDKI